MLLSDQVRLARGTAYTLQMCQLAMARKALGASDDVVRDLTKQWAVGMCARTGVEVHASGVDAVDWTQPYVIMANHQSYLDVLALYRALPRAFGIVAKRSLFAVPFFGGVMRALGCVSVDRSRHVEAARAMSDAGQTIRSSRASIAVFPEGTRSPGDRIAKLKKGPFHLAQHAGVPIVPIGIRGTSALMPRSNTAIRSGVVELRVGAPIAAIVDGNGAARDKARRTVREALGELAGVPLRD
jgi:1-acyl-sn-glycerol-3-phosphate acyltransferase